MDVYWSMYWEAALQPRQRAVMQTPGEPLDLVAVADMFDLDPKLQLRVRQASGVVIGIPTAAQITLENMRLKTGQTGTSASPFLLQGRPAQGTQAPGTADAAGVTQQVLARLDALQNTMTPIAKVCLDRLSATRCASSINQVDLAEVRSALRITIQMKDEGQQPDMPDKDSFWDARYEVQEMERFKSVISSWVSSRRSLRFVDARGIVLRQRPDLDFPISGANDLVLTLRQFCRSPSLGALLGMELKRGLTALGLRQAELEFYLWSQESPFPFVQLITDMRTGGVAFYKTGTTADGYTNLVQQFLNGMDSVQAFVQGVYTHIPDDAGEDGPGGTMNIPESMSHPSRKRRRNASPDRSGNQESGSGAPGGQNLTAAFKLMAALQPDVAVLSDLDCFDIPALRPEAQPSMQELPAAFAEKACLQSLSVSPSGF